MRNVLRKTAQQIGFIKKEFLLMVWLVLPILIITPFLDKGFAAEKDISLRAIVLLLLQLLKKLIRQW